MIGPPLPFCDHLAVREPNAPQLRPVLETLVSEIANLFVLDERDVLFVCVEREWLIPVSLLVEHGFLTSDFQPTNSLFAQPLPHLNQLTVLK